MILLNFQVMHTGLIYFSSYKQWCRCHFSRENWYGEHKCISVYSFWFVYAKTLQMWNLTVIISWLSHLIYGLISVFSIAQDISDTVIVKVILKDIRKIWRWWSLSYSILFFLLSNSFGLQKKERQVWYLSGKLMKIQGQFNEVLQLLLRFCVQFSPFNPHWATVWHRCRCNFWSRHWSSCTFVCQGYLALLSGEN